MSIGIIEGTWILALIDNFAKVNNLVSVSESEVITVLNLPFTMRWLYAPSLQMCMQTIADNTLHKHDLQTKLCCPACLPSLKDETSQTQLFYSLKDS